MNSDHIYIHHHLGLGDHIICNGLIRFLANTSTVGLFCKPHNKQSVQCMYSDSKNISVIEVNNDLDAENLGKIKSQYIRLGIAFNNNIPIQMSWDEAFYYQLGIPYTYSWELFKFNKEKKQNQIPNKQYAFLCNKGSDGIDGIDYSKINTSLDLVFSNSGNFFENIDLIEGASEIHCINSAFIHLIDRLDSININTKLYYHKNFKLKPFSDFTLKKHWIVI